MTPSDDDLIRQYVREGSNPAFAELVRRYLNIVYSAALRQVRSTALAEEISQSVFLDLSKSAAKLKSGRPLIAWLYLVTRRTAIDTIRRESRRQVREKIASEIAAMKTDPSFWAQIEPFLDEALAALSETDRQAILLRYMANKSLHEVGQTLGTSDDAAQKRVSRALEQLRMIFTRRGIAITAAGLATDLSANVVVSAPAGLGASISSGALPAALLAQTANTLSMTALNKSLIATAVVLLASLALETKLLGTGRNQLLEFEQKISRQQVQAQQLAEERDRVAATLAQMHQDLESDRDRVKKENAVDSDLEQWLGRVSRLRDWLGRMPERNIPEMRFLTSSDWLAVTLNNDLQTEAKIKLALTDLRRIAKLKPEMRQNLLNALRAYRDDHNGRSATEIAQLRPYLSPLLDDDILLRYEFVPVPASFAPEMRSTGESVLHEKVAVDEDYDVLAEYVAGGANVKIFLGNLGKAVNEATMAFAKAHDGQEPTAATQVLPYMTGPVDEVKVKEYWEAHSRGRIP